MILKRKVTKQIQDILRDKKQILIYGAKCIGKTFEAINYCKSNKKDYELIDFKGEIDIVSIFKSDAVDKVLILDNIHYNTAIFKWFLKHQCIFKCQFIFIVDSFFYNLYNISENEIVSIEIKPFTFTEFLSNTRRLETKSVYELYRLLGGYPEVIKTFLCTSNYNECVKVYNSILNKLWLEFNRTYDQLTQYYSANAKFYELTYSSPEVQLFANVLSTNKTNSVICYLYLAGLLDYTRVIVSGELIDITAKRFFPKDLGLFYYAVTTIEHANENHLKGFITECFAFNELKCSIGKKSIEEELYYMLSGDYELDFVLKQNNRIIGIEVKTVTGTHKSMTFLKQNNYINSCIKLGMYKKSFSNGIIKYPIYLIGDLYKELIA